MALITPAIVSASPSRDPAATAAVCKPKDRQQGQGDGRKSCKPACMTRRYILM